MLTELSVASEVTVLHTLMSPEHSCCMAMENCRVWKRLYLIGFDSAQNYKFHSQQLNSTLVPPWLYSAARRGCQREAGQDTRFIPVKHSQGRVCQSSRHWSNKSHLIGAQGN